LFYHTLLRNHPDTFETVFPWWWHSGHNITKMLKSATSVQLTASKMVNNG